MARILIVDDSASNRELLRSILENAGHVVTEAADGEEALAAMAAAPPALAIVDIQMPRLDGYGVLERMLADERLRGTPVIALTAYAMERDRERGLAAGFQAYLTKPITLRLLRQVLAEVLPAEKDQEEP
jgi:two-component system, cell cycle response regulator DivK